MTRRVIYAKHRTRERKRVTARYHLSGTENLIHRRKAKPGFSSARSERNGRIVSASLPRETEAPGAGIVSASGALLQNLTLSEAIQFTQVCATVVFVLTMSLESFKPPPM